MDTREKIKIGIIGCGKVGFIRAKCIANNPDAKLVALYDNNSVTVCKLREFYRNNFPGSPSTFDYELDSFLELCDAVIIATPHFYLGDYAKRALEKRKHVLIEKPGAINSQELEEIKKLAREKRKIVEIGYTLPYYSSIVNALNCNISEDLMYIRGIYGHGGRIGYEKEWRFDKHLSGGGELMDQGVHLIHLSLLFLKESITKIIGSNLKSYYWDKCHNIEDNCFMLLSTESGKTISLQASWTEWENKFLFEIMYKRKKVTLSGLGGNYGPNVLSKSGMFIGKEGYKPAKESYETNGLEDPWQRQTDLFINSINRNENYNYSINSALETLKLVEKIYKQKKCHRC